MKLERIQTFLVVANEKSFIKAANKLKISNAAVSRQIQQLEESLAIKLFERTTRQVDLTDLGKQYYFSCQKALSELQLAENFIESTQKEPSGTLKIVSPHYFIQKLILPKLSHFLERYPKIDIDLEVAERAPDLFAENVDILFGVSVAMPDNTVRKRIAKTRYILCASPQYLKKYGNPKKISDLTQHHYLTHTMRDDPKRIEFKNKAFTIVEPYLHLNSAQLMKECALLNLGIIRLHEYIVSEAIKKGQLVEVLPQYASPETGIYLYYRHNTYLPSKIRAFVDFFT